MAKRLSDTEIWKKKWFRELPPKHKCFIKYVLDSCNLIGIWEVDFDGAEFYINEKIDHDEIRGVLKDKIIEFDDGRKWLYKSFIFFQYGLEYKSKSPIHKKVAENIRQTSIFKSSGVLYDTLWYSVYDTLYVPVSTEQVLFSPNGVSISDQFDTYLRGKWADDNYVRMFCEKMGLSTAVVKGKMEDFRNYIVGLEDDAKIPKTEKGIIARFTTYLKTYIKDYKNA